MANGANGTGHDIIVVGASTGGVEAIMHLTSRLPVDLPAAVFVVVHFPPDGSSVLPRLINRRSALPATHAADGEPITRGRIYVARPDYHLLLEPGRVRLAQGPRENRARPAVDVLFRSAALAYGPRVIGVVLTGALDDGAAGLVAIKRRGGLAVVQDPADALIPGMPLSVLARCEVDHVAPLAALPALLTELSRAPAPQEGAYPVPREMEIEVGKARLDEAVMQELVGAPTSYTCPECKGPLREIQEGGLARYRCQTGHAYSVGTWLVDQSDALEEALWVAVNTLQESARMAERLAHDAQARGSELVAARFEEKRRQTLAQAEVVRRVLAERQHSAMVEVLTQEQLGEDPPASPEAAASGDA
jgi:two-component system chemotaxis response regulator CheB